MPRARVPAAQRTGTRRVPAEVLHAQHRQLHASVPQLRSEGFTEVIIDRTQAEDILS
jgi:hypothetical protein